MVKFLLEWTIEQGGVSIIIEAPSAQAAKTWLLANHGDKTIADIIQIFENQGGVLRTDFELECTGELIPK